jgi:hypothetical protein
MQVKNRPHLLFRGSSACFYSINRAAFLAKAATGTQTAVNLVNSIRADGLSRANINTETTDDAFFDINEKYHTFPL